MQNVASMLAYHLKALGVKTVFGIPGKSIVPLLFGLEKHELHFVLCRHEAGAGFAASGYALQNRSLGVAIGTSGPGGTNMITAAGQAKAFNLPVLFITGHPSMKETGRALAQDSTPFGTDMAKLFEPVTLFSRRVERADQFPMYLKHAVETAFSGTKGPVHLSIPHDVLSEEIDFFPIHLQTSAQVISLQIDKISPILNKAQKPLIILGKGVHSSHAYQEVQSFAELWGIPVVTTPGGKGTFATHHPLSLGSFGLGGTPQAMAYLQSGIDLAVVIGSSLNDMSMAGFIKDMYPTQVVHFDCESTYIGKTFSAPTTFIEGDIKLNLQKVLLAGAPDDTSRSRGEVMQAFTTAVKEAAAAVSTTSIGSKNAPYISAVEAIKVLRANLPADAVVFGDEGSHSFYAIQNFNIYEPGTFHFDAAFGTMGYSFGYAIGAKIASPDKTIMCLAGDGSLFMHGTEISTAVNEEAAVIFIVFNNSRLDMVDKGMAGHMGRSIGSIYNTGVKVKEFAESLGAKGTRCYTAEEIEKAIRKALNNIQSSVIEVMVDPLEVPPTMLRG
ncbi:thiamine pyrophosphate-binding protein [Aneurinibacillus sp. Ricciae_BoGa-3]|nr:thiamine pyrophosphate-binding protein [Aneurinibacillus sp. Ricciae_BoGa-3]WCK56794.1 thiamine pyrophosphate-binding protein [Aneurinibacillus sp. Ricciae_BoGa-3]